MTSEEINNSCREELKHAIDSIYDSYNDIEEMNNIEGATLPSKAIVRELAEDYMSLVFPGFYTKEFADKKDMRAYIENKCCTMLERLAIEIEKGVRYNCRLGKMSCLLADSATVAREVAVEFLNAIPEIREKAHMDVHAADECDPAARSIFEVVLSYPGVEALTMHRFAHFLYSRGVPFIPRMLCEYVHSKTGIDIHPGATIGNGVFIDHGTGVVVGETTIIGDRVKIYQGVTLGALSVSKNMAESKRHPTIEENVTIYSGATILGGRTVVGRDSVIGGNVWLVESVPPGSKVYIESPRLICKTCEKRPADCPRFDDKDKCPENQ